MIVLKNKSKYTATLPPVKGHPLPRPVASGSLATVTEEYWDAVKDRKAVTGLFEVQGALKLPPEGGGGGSGGGVIEVKTTNKENA